MNDGDTNHGDMNDGDMNDGDMNDGDTNHGDMRGPSAIALAGAERCPPGPAAAD